MKCQQCNKKFQDADKVLYVKVWNLNRSHSKYVCSKECEYTLKKKIYAVVVECIILILKP